jgi:hypothetical protein
MMLARYFCCVFSMVKTRGAKRGASMLKFTGAYSSKWRQTRLKPNKNAGKNRRTKGGAGKCAVSAAPKGAQQFIERADRPVFVLGAGFRRRQRRIVDLGARHPAEQFVVKPELRAGHQDAAGAAIAFDDDRFVVRMSDDFSELARGFMGGDFLHFELLLASARKKSALCCMKEVHGGITRAAARKLVRKSMGAMAGGGPANAVARRRGSAHKAAK